MTSKSLLSDPKDERWSMMNEPNDQRRTTTTLTLEDINDQVTAKDQMICDHNEQLSTDHTVM